MASGDDIKSAKELKLLTIDQLKLEKDRLDALVARTAEEDKYLKIVEKTLKAAERNAAAVERRQQFLTDEIAKLEAMNANEENRALKLERQRMISEAKNELIDIELALLEDKLKISGELTDEEMKRLQDLREIVRLRKEEGKQLQKNLDLAKRMGNAMAVYGEHTVLNVQNVEKLAQGLKDGGLDFAKAFAVSAMDSFLNTIINLAVKLESLEQKFRQNTGASADFARSLTTTYESTREFGVSMEEVSKAYKSLYTTFTDFTMLSEASRESIAEVGVTLGEFGVKVEDFAKGMQVATKAFGMSAEAAAATALELNAMAQDLGVTPEQMASDFAKVGGSLAKLGDQGVAAFEDLARVSKVTGMEMEKILKITDKFDTFEGAAEQAGKLNAALGTNAVDAMDLMMATDPTERFDTIRDSILNAGLSFDNMSYYQRKFYTDALGLSDVSDLAMMLSGNYDDLSGNMGMTSAELLDQQEKAKEMKDMQEKLNLALMELVPILIPLIEGLTTFASWVERNAEKIKFLVDIAWKYWAAMKAWGILKTIIGFLKGMKTLFTLLAPAKIADAAATDTQTAANARAAPVMRATWKQMLAMGLAALMLGKGIQFAAEGIASLAESVKGLEGDEMLFLSGVIVALGIGFAIFIKTMSGMAKMAPKAALAVAVVVGALVGLGYAVKLVGEGLGFMAEGFSGLVDSVTAFLDSDLSTAATDAVTLATAFGTLTLAMWSMVTAGIVARGTLAGIKNLFTKIEPITEGLATVFENMPKSGDLGTLVADFEDIAAAINEVQGKSTMSHTFGGASAALAAAKELIEARNTAPAGAGAVAGGKGTATAGASAGGGGGTTSRVTVQLNLDGQVLATKVVDIVGEEAFVAAAGGN